MLAECRCVSGAAARTGDDQLRWLTLKARRKGRQRLRQAAQLPPDYLSLTLANSDQAYRPRGMRNIGSLSTIS
jgi:hypothetical protein